jgi:hypothetical protein
MNRLLSSVGLGFVIAACIATSILAKDPPASAEQLRSELESALKAKDTNTVFSLFRLAGGGGDIISYMATGAMLATNITSVALLPLPTNFQQDLDKRDNENGFGDTWEGDNGSRTKYSLPVLGLLGMKSQAGDVMQLPYGETNDAFYIAGAISYLAPGKPLYVRVLGNVGSYTGSWVFVNSGKEITVNISDQTNQYRQCWGDYIKSCTIQSTSTNSFIQNQNRLYFEISEDRTNIFESGEITNDKPFTYTRKP